MKLLELRNLRVGYNDLRPLIEDAKASLGAGKIGVLIGANGSGKSTLLRALSGFTTPQGGEILIDGNSLGSLSRRELARLIAVVTTETPQCGQLSVLDLVRLGRQPYSGMFGKLSSEDRAIADDAIAATGLESLSSKVIATLSDGERQKAMIARAIAQQPRLLLMDEPTGFLDVAARIETMKLLRHLTDSSESGMSVLLSSHDIASALDAADDVWVIDPGTHRLVCARKEDALADPVLLNLPFADRGVRFDSERGDYVPINPSTL